MEELATTSIFAMYLAGRRNMKTTYQVLLVAFIGSVALFVGDFRDVSGFPEASS
jgi:hypothetical protein